MIVIEQGISIGQGIQIGDRPVLAETLFFVTEDGANFLISQDGNNFVEFINV
tara:strand:- start:329 stop:484 length:156 start_codon:yes stop_codon:yes gene_type:complete